MFNISGNTLVSINGDLSDEQFYVDLVVGLNSDVLSGYHLDFKSLRGKIEFVDESSRTESFAVSVGVENRFFLKNKKKKKNLN